MLFSGESVISRYRDFALPLAVAAERRNVSAFGPDLSAPSNFACCLESLAPAGKDRHRFVTKDMPVLRKDRWSPSN